MFKIGEKYRETKDCFGIDVNVNLTIVDGPRKMGDRKEWYCKGFHVKEAINPRTKEKFLAKFTNFYWLGEDYLLNNLNQGRMYLRHEKR